MKLKKTLFLALTIILSCQNEEDIIKGDEKFISKIDLIAKDSAILEKAYSAYLFPDNFNYEQNPDASTYYENTVSIRSSERSWIELSTDNRNQAKEWSEISSLTSAYYRDLVEERETEKFFEFRRVYSLRPTDIILSRVHKSSYFIPILDKLNRGDTVGTLKKNPITTTTSKDFIEYMWPNNLMGYSDKVLETSIIEYSDRIRYNLKALNIIYGDWGMCDTIEIIEFDFFIDRKSGLVTYTSNKIKELIGRC